MRSALLALGLLILILPQATPASDLLVTDLDNGLKVIIQENHQVPQVNISTTVRVGAKNETDYFDGATHFLEHLILFRGTEKMTGDEVGNAMKQHGAYFNGYTSSDWTDFIISLPGEYLDFALQIHADMLFRSNFPAEEMDKERQAVYEEINITEDNPFGKAYRATLGTLYGKHPYSKNVLGTQEKILSIPRDSVYAYYKRYYAPNNMTMVIIGDVNAQSTLNLVKKYFGDFPRGSTPQDMYAPPPVYNKVQEIKISKDINQAYLIMAGIGPTIESPDQFALDIMATVLGSGESSRLWKRLRDEMGIVYSTGFAFYTQKYEGTIFASATLDPDKIPQVEQAIVEILNDVKQNGFTETELRKAKNKIKTGFFSSLERGLDRADSYAQHDAYGNYKFVDRYADNIENVTLAQLNEAAKKYLNTDSYVKTTVVPK
jgi:predicted Zn-dependent peptidase